MDMKQLTDLITQGEDSKNQFKANVKSPDSLAAEITAFANSEGGTIYIGVADDGSFPGLDIKDVGRINQLISNTASQHVRSPISVYTENVRVKDDRIVIIVKIPKGIDKPYFDKNGVIWLKTGADKRRVNSKEELRRLFQSVDLLHGDEVPTKADINQLDRLRFRDFLKEIYGVDMPENPKSLVSLLQNMNLASENGMLNLAGVLLFGLHPEWIKPQFIVKGVCFPGNEISTSIYNDSEDFSGPLQKVFNDSLAFVLRNLKKIQDSQNVNSIGKPEVPKLVFEELLVNALIHRDYFVSAVTRIFIFDNRIEIISPGHLPNNLTIEKIRAGNSNLRNPILASFAAKKIVPYRGLGSGIRRALSEWQHIDFFNDRKGCTFTATVYRDLKVQNEANEPLNEPINEPLNQIQVQILQLIESDPAISYQQLAQAMDKGRSTIMRQVQALKDMNILQRMGSKKSGRWEIKQGRPQKNEPIK